MWIMSRVVGNWLAETGGWDVEFGHGLADARRATGPYVFITGPDHIQANAECEWTGLVNTLGVGDLLDHTFAWYNNEDQLLSSTSNVTYSVNQEEDFELRLVVTDEQDVAGEFLFEVAVSSTGDDCSGGGSLLTGGGGQ